MYFIFFVYIIFFIAFIIDVDTTFSFRKRKELRINNIYKNDYVINSNEIKNNKLYIFFLNKITSIISKLKLIDFDSDHKEKKYLDLFGIDYSYFLSIKVCMSFFCFFILLFILFFLKIEMIYLVLFSLVSGFVGFKFPDFVLDQKRKYHFSRVETGMADALDLFLVCAEAGLAMESAMECVAIEMVDLNKDVADEFRITINEMRISNDRVRVIEDLGKRTGLATMQRLSGALIQTFETGSSLVSVLKVLVSEIREDSLIKFEEKAARLSIMLTFPMIIFLLPCMFIVIAGPAMLNLMGVLKN